MNSRLITPTGLVLALVAAGVVGGAGTNFVSGSLAHAQALGTPIAASKPIESSTGAFDFSQITERYGSAVVNISVSGVQQASNDVNEAPAIQRRGIPGLDPNDPFFEFFRRFQVPNGSAPDLQGDMLVHGQGSGFIVGADGIILTNAHVVRNAKEVMVKLTDRREFQARVLGSDVKTDIAVLKIEAKNLPVVPLGSTRNLKVGEWVLAIGSPFGFENSVSAGVVSAKGRSLPDDSFVPFLQTDVAVNPGNSGGPLFNTHGEVVGINSQIYSQTGGYQGVSFAIPIDLAITVKDQIVATGQAKHARLGVAIQEINQTLADSFHLDKPEGALISNVDPGGAAEKAGLKTGDVIRQVNGQRIVSSGDLPAVIGGAMPGDKITLEVWRQEKSEQLTAILGDANVNAVKVAKAVNGGDKGKLGLALRPLQPQEQRESGLEGGMVIENVAGPAALAGIQAGDVLLAVNGTPVKDIEQVRAVVAKSSKSMALLIQREGNKIFVPVRIG